MRALRGNCMGAAVLIAIQVALGTAVNLYVTVPKNKSFAAAVFSNATLAVHALLGLLLLGAAIGVLVRAVRARHRFMVWDGAIGLAAVIAAIGAGSGFVNSPDNGASLGMAVAAAVALVCYLAGVFRLGVND
jgi:uncharacterized membrane protein YhaH (DUF805 family)